MRFPWPLALSVPLLAGCLDAAPGPSTPSPEPRLADFAACDFHYPNGSKVPCENRASRLQVSGTEAPTGWVCVRQSSEPYSYFKLYYSPVQDRHGVRFDYHDRRGVPGPSGGLVLLQTDTPIPRTIALYGWEHSGTRGFFELPPEAETGLSVDLYAYQMWYQSNTTLLQNGKLRGLWSAYRETNTDTWLIYELQASGQTSFFEKMNPYPLGRTTVHEPGSLKLEGADFDLDIRFIASGHQGFPLDGAGVPCDAPLSVHSSHSS